jgi:hypothetical protein
MGIVSIALLRLFDGVEIKIQGEINCELTNIPTAGLVIS